MKKKQKKTLSKIVDIQNPNKKGKKEKHVKIRSKKQHL